LSASLREQKGDTIRIKDVFKSFLRSIRKKSEKASDFLKKVVAGIPRFLYRSRKTIFLVVVVVLVTLVFNFLIVSWFNNGASNNGNNGNGNNGVNDQTVPTTGTLYVNGLEIYGGDIKSDSGNDSIDWGELSIGDSKNASFYVQSTSDIGVELGLNVTNWTPPGIEDYITISWDYNGTLLSPGSEAPLVTVSLDVSSSGDFIDFIVANEVTSFGFDITVYASDS
jgi:hypothetical protein